jgi:hypothetical protein
MAIMFGHQDANGRGERIPDLFLQSPVRASKTAEIRHFRAPG